MSRLHRRWPTVALAVLVSAGVAASEPPAIEDFVAGNVNDMVRISPTGRYLAAIVRIDDEAWFRIITYPEKETSVSFALSERRGVADVSWVADDLVLVQLLRRIWGSDAMGRTGELFTVQAETGKVTRLEPGGLAYLLPEDPDHVITYRTRDRFMEAYRLNVRTGRDRRIARGAAPRGQFVPDRDGGMAFSTGVSETNRQEIHRRVGQRWELVESHGLDEAGWTPVWFGTRPGTWLTYDTRGALDTVGLSLYDEETGEHESIIRHPKADVSRVFYDFTRTRAWGVQFDHHYPAIQYLDTTHALSRQHAQLARMFPEDVVTFNSTTRDHKIVIAEVASDRKPGDFLLIDMAEGKIAPLMQRRPALPSDKLAAMQPVEITTRDDATIYGYLTVPDQWRRPGPMVVWIHGGPHGVRDTWGYDTQVQLLASRGYAVLQVNFRGSSGYGRAYEGAGYGEWGALMQDDVTDATLWAIKSGVADADRVCVGGGSFGAYSAMMGAAREPDLYACVVGMFGIYDLTLMERTGDVRQRNSGTYYIRRVIGDDREALQLRSPVTFADRIKASVMLVHGGQDRRAPPTHTHRMREALEGAGHEVEWLEDADQGHGFFGKRALVNLWMRIFEFLDQEIGDTPPA